MELPYSMMCITSLIHYNAGKYPLIMMRGTRHTAAKRLIEIITNVSYFMEYDKY
jgi:hypothetical protein